MTTYGVTATGFVTKPQDVIRTGIIAAMKAASAIGPNKSYSTASALGQLAGVLSGDAAELWELLALVWASNDPEAALGVSLLNVCSLTGTTQRAASPTRVVCVVNLDAGTTLPAGTLASVDGRPDLQFSLDADVTNPGGSAADISVDVDGNFVTFSCTQTGPIAVSAGTLTVQVTSVSGWNSVTNAADGVEGRDIEGPIDLRQRRQAQLALRGGSTVRAIRAAVLEIPEVLSCHVLENKTDGTDANGLPPHSYEVVLDDGPTPAASDNTIAQTIFDHGDPAGIQGVGTSSGTARDTEGNEYTVYFSRVEREDVYIDLTLTTGATFTPSGADLVKAAIVEAGNGYGPGDTAVALFLRSQAFSVAGVVDVPAFTLGYSSSPVGTSNLVVTARRRNTFDTSRITVTIA